MKVDDDGSGPSEASTRGNGVGNMRQRAEGLSGDFTIGARGTGGTTVVWNVPLKLHA